MKSHSRGLLAATAIALLTPLAGPAQQFEAASLKPNRGTGKRDRTRSIEPGRITYMDTTLGEFIAMAYDVKRYQISGPDWITGLSSSTTYDLVATAGKPATPAEMRRMLRPLLEERFHLAFHRETRELPVYALLPAKGGPTFKEPGDGGPQIVGPDEQGGLRFHNWSMENFADWLSILPNMGRPAIDRTGIAGNFSFHANLFGQEKGTPVADLKRAMMDADAAGAIRAALPGQLGLRLEPEKAQIEILVVDHADRAPIEN